MKKLWLSLALLCSTASTTAATFTGLPAEGVETPSPFTTEFTFPYMTNGYHNSVLRTWLNSAMQEADAEYKKTGEISQTVNSTYISMDSNGYGFWKDSTDMRTMSPSDDMRALSTLAMAPLKWACSVSGSACFDSGFEYSLRMNADSSKFDVNGSLDVGWANLRRESCRYQLGKRVCYTVNDMNYGGDLAGFWIKALNWLNTTEDLSNIKTSIDQATKTFDRPYLMVNATLIPGMGGDGNLSYFHMADSKWWETWQKQVNSNSVQVGYKLALIEPILTGNSSGLYQTYSPQTDDLRNFPHLEGRIPLYEYSSVRAIEILKMQRENALIGASMKAYAGFNNNFESCRANMIMTGDEGYLPAPGYSGGVTSIYGVAPSYDEHTTFAIFAWAANTKSESKMYDLANYDHNTRVFLHEIGHNYGYGHNSTPNTDQYWKDLSEERVPYVRSKIDKGEHCGGRVL
ncbi:hypothetical protein phiGrn1_0220 [Vibrio phage phi-Grn1]|uniref:Uncharacterized protein n=1 Tax=Vibrio phage phi-Grn1 TaxID=1747713 RepID=A0A140B3G0_9CAUD|nr:hypothetical protein phiGrn1_0220 [Vibrio phage phi-Grn1]